MPGRVAVERGTHAELTALDGSYKELHDRRYRIEMNRFVHTAEELAPAMVGTDVQRLSRVPSRCRLTGRRPKP